MPKHFLNRWYGRHMQAALLVMTFMITGLFMYHWLIGIVALIPMCLLIYYMILAERAFRKDFSEYISTLTDRIKLARNEVVQQLPLGIVLYNEDKLIEWHNPFVGSMFGKDSVIGESLHDYFPQLKNKKDKDHPLEIRIGSAIYSVTVKASERLLYITEITEKAELQRKYEEGKPVIGIVMLDNVDEATQGMDEQTRSLTMTKVTGAITEWCKEKQIYLRRSASDRFLMVMDQKTLSALEQTRFDILDKVKDLTGDLKVPFTLSIGIAAGTVNLVELGNIAQTSLDISLGRGGDQAVVKSGDRISFYGGRSNAVEKSTRVRARVISHALRDLMKESDRILIMGHKTADLDVIGSAVGIWKAAQWIEKEAYVVLEEVNPSIRRLMDRIAEEKVFREAFISPEMAMELATGRTLLVIVDTHKASMLPEPRLVQLTHRVVVIDHHRRGEQFLEDVVLLYMEPYASSTSELVTELLQYFQDRAKLDPMEATALLAGITVDTKNFSTRTGARTHEAASFLRRNGADPGLVQSLLQEDLGSFVQKAEIIKHTEIIYDHIAVAVAEPGRTYSQLIIAQVADTLINMADIKASFVIGERPDGLIGISARSQGELNVQVVMERLGGGGHLTHAAVQLADTTLDEALQRLKQVLGEIEGEEGLFI